MAAPVYLVGFHVIPCDSVVVSLQPSPELAMPVREGAAGAIRAGPGGVLRPLAPLLLPWKCSIAEPDSLKAELQTGRVRAVVEE